MASKKSRSKLANLQLVQLIIGLFETNKTYFLQKVLEKTKKSVKNYKVNIWWVKIFCDGLGWVRKKETQLGLGWVGSDPRSPLTRSSY